MGVFAEFERAMIQERPCWPSEGQERGKRLGRPRIAPALEKRIRKALAIPEGRACARSPNSSELIRHGSTD